ncbi:MAG: exodeoxyribonuclease VII large subunit [Ilumatobacteraceae bacterium]|jgi:exodeoxyribonuclease VII large subunit|nr:exodeoxyribonuclease VII large subunit [Ilumatobacteraceae bacterium]MDP5068011.1 exodeoxyribonuclease VII large subunit [Ilumatobacteraceae bacterium]
MTAEVEFINGVPSFSVGQFTEVLNHVLKASFDEGVWVEGEIQGLRKPNPHAYFTLIENVDGVKAQLNINLFAGPLRNVQAKLRQQGIELKDGLKVRLFGRVEYYGPFGKLNLIATDVDTQFSAGDVAAKREELLRQLMEKGVDKINKRIPVPLVPLRLGIISSSQAAGWADAQQHLTESGIGFAITFCDVRVQGDAAVSQIVAALNSLSRRDDIDLVMLMRGGGSKGDLAAFDDEQIAMAISKCAHPVFTGIGHEIDTSIADIVAHTANKTPTACAQSVIAIVENFLSDLSYSAGSLRSLTQTAVERARSRIAVSVERLRTRPRTALERQSQKLMMHAASVRLLDPVTTMARGWSITRDSSGNVVRSISDIKKGDTVVTALADGSITSTVEGVA